MFVSVAHAMGTTGAAGSAEGAFMQFVPLILMLVIFYFLLIRPQQKRAKQHRAMLAALKKGDQVMTSGGLLGRITAIDGDILTIDLGKTEVNIGRGFITGLVENKEAK
ncbi:MAG TPA: preprotein translocase subunit YajC [Candidatus Avidesulfovibrio excrementigallinarum]|nr:preprotein translocase subunit YajC [Candidatus Avidesulfovibrio excrementigallinarum]